MSVRRTKIVATLGPASNSPEVLEQLILAGIDVARLNFSHGTPDEHRARARLVRELAAKHGRFVALLGDLQGPKIRIAKFANKRIELQVGDKFRFSTSHARDAGTQEVVGIDYPDLVKDCGVGDELLLDDGRVVMVVEEVAADELRCRVLIGGPLSDHKGINRRGGGLTAPALTDKDKADIKLAADMDLDYVAVSFPRDAKDMEYARRLLTEAGGKAWLVAKIERAEAVADDDALDGLIRASDAVMVARGDLGVEIGDAELPGLQKKIIKASLAQNKVVITATQMLQSMVESPIPTRAEVLDVANSVIDGTDAVMLSAETAAGAYPVKAVEAMARICLGAERQFQTETDFNASPRNLERADQAIAMATMFLSQHVGVRAIVAMTESGGTARYLSRFRAKAPVFAVTRHDGARRQMALMRDVFPINFDSRGLTPREAARGSIRLLVEAELLQAGDRVVFTSGEHMETLGATNTLRLLEVGEDGRASGLGDL